MSSNVVTTTPVVDCTIDNTMKKIVLVMLILGVVMIVVGYNLHQNTQSFPEIIYKYIPKSYYDEMFIQPPVRSIFGRMFSNVSPWHEAKPGYDYTEPIYSYNHFVKRGAYNFYDNQDLYYDYAS